MRAAAARMVSALPSCPYIRSNCARNRGIAPGLNGTCADFHVTPPQFSRLYAETLVRVGLLDPKQVLPEFLTKRR